MTELESRFEKEIDSRKFNILESLGFAKNSRLAMLAGMAMGYKLAAEDIQNQLRMKEKQHGSL